MKLVVLTLDELKWDHSLAIGVIFSILFFPPNAVWMRGTSRYVIEVFLTISKSMGIVVRSYSQISLYSRIFLYWALTNMRIKLGDLMNSMTPFIWTDCYVYLIDLFVDYGGAVCRHLKISSKIGNYLHFIKKCLQI